MKIFTIADKKEGKFLRTKTADFNFTKFTKKEIGELIKKMREAMNKAVGIGLSANQIGLNLRLFVAQISKTTDDKKFYAIFNPEITKFSEKKIVMEEGCLSVPGIYGEVKRPEKITLRGRDRYGKIIAIKADDFLARVFQHETDHLNGILFIDKAVNLRKHQNEQK